MHIALKDKTNKKTEDMERKIEIQTDKDIVVKLLKEKEQTTKDFNLRYDLIKCIEILEGKENQEFIDLKAALEEIIEEKERLFKDKCELSVELDYYKSKEKKHKKK
jgi:hypothetical protein